MRERVREMQAEIAHAGVLGRLVEQREEEEARGEAEQENALQRFVETIRMNKARAGFPLAVGGGRLKKKQQELFRF